ncbi:DUF5797 family protein [Halobacteriaceae archaeon GCM10025711]
MALSDEARERLADIVELQPTKNKDLMDRWGMESGSDVHSYLEDELKEYYYRDDNSLIRATAEAADLVGADPGVEEGESGTTVRVPELESQVVEVLDGPDGESRSVVAVLKALRAAYDVDPTAEEVRKALQHLRRKGVVEVVYRTVPTFRLALARDDITVERTD